MPHQHDARLLAIFRGAGATDEFARTLAQALQASELEVADPTRNELVTRWVDVNDQAVPPDADTIIRTITRSRGDQHETFTHWLSGLRGPRLP